MARRLYFPELTTGDVTVEGSEAHHGRDVLRLRVGEMVELFDGNGGYAEGTLVRIGKSELEFRVTEVRRDEVMGPVIVLATAVPKFAHQEILVRMGTELGINAFCPIICERSSVREQFRTDKWRRWSVEACKQCGGNILPRIDDVQDFKSLLDTVGAYDFAIFGDMQGQQCDWKAEIGRSRKILIFVGPEGGFTDGEVDQMRKAGVAGMRIGPHVLRIETAGVALTSAVQFSAR